MILLLFQVSYKLNVSNKLTVATDEGAKSLLCKTSQSTNPCHILQVYSKSKEWDLLARWSISFCNETQVYDEMDSRLLDLVSCAWPVT